MTINGVELPFKLTNATTADRYETALRVMQADADHLRANPPERLADGIRSQIALVRAFVDGVFGDGIYAKLGADPDDLDENLDIVAQIIADAGEQTKAIQKRNAKYSPTRSARNGVKKA